MRYLLGIIAILIVFGCMALFFVGYTERGVVVHYPLPTAYDIDTLARIPVPAFSVSVTEIRRMDHEAFRIISRVHRSEQEVFALYAKLALLERRFVALSYAVSGGARGSIVPLAHRVVCEALPEDCVFMWRTLDDYHAFDDAYTRALTDAVMSTAGSFDTRVVSEPAFSPSVFSIESATSSYESMTASRTLEQRRAAALWSAGNGTRQAPGILLDMIDDYLALDTTRSIGDYAIARGNLVVRAYDAYRGAHALSVRTPHPAVSEVVDTFPAMVTAIHAVAPHLRPLLHERAQADLDTEVVDATHAFLWSGNYYPDVVADAERLGEVYADAVQDAFDIP